MENPIEFWDRFYTFFVADDKARWKAMGWIIVTGGTLGSIDLTFGNSSLDDVLIFLTVWIILGYVVSIAWYCSFSRESELEIPNLISRRSVIQYAAALITLFLALRIPRAEALITEHKLKEASENPGNLTNIETAKQTLAKAKANNVNIRPDVVERVGKKFAEAAKINPAAWDVAVGLGGYKSLQNAFPDVGNLNELSETNYMWAPRWYPEPHLQHFGRVPIARAARLNFIGKDLNAGKTYGDGFIVFKGGGGYLALDDMDIKNAVLEDAQISYGGGPLRLENVYIVNCTLRIRQTPNGETLVSTLLNSKASSISFTAY